MTLAGGGFEVIHYHLPGWGPRTPWRRAASSAGEPGGRQRQPTGTAGIRNPDTDGPPRFLRRRHELADGGVPLPAGGWLTAAGRDQPAGGRGWDHDRGGQGRRHAGSGAETPALHVGWVASLPRTGGPGAEGPAR